jgi:spectrin beta
LLQQEYTLAHLEPPESLEAAEAGIRKFEDFLVSMENNRDKVLSPVDSGNKLVDEGNLYSDKIKEKMQLIEDRYSLPLESWGSMPQRGWGYQARTPDSALL